MERVQGSNPAKFPPIARGSTTSMPGIRSSPALSTHDVAVLRRRTSIELAVRGRRPDIDPSKHRLVIHGLVKQPLVFDVEALSR
jgi:DMSO/TMAO reductase YedYZ molybdopterin-dependent catalytic subunit